MARTPTSCRSAGLVVVQSMDERARLVSVDELRKVVALLLVLADSDNDLALEAERLAHDLALRLPAG